MRPLGSGTCRSRSVVERDARARRVARAIDIDEIDVVAHLRDGRPRRPCCRTLANVCELRPSRARLVLVDADPQLPRRLDPVEVERRLFGLVATMRQAGARSPRTFRVGAADALLQRPADRRPQLQGLTRPMALGKVLRQDLVELDPEPFAGRHILGDDHEPGRRNDWAVAR